MSIIVREFRKTDIEQALAIWNGVVEDGNAFPQEKPMCAAEGIEFFFSQSYTGVAECVECGKLVGLYILHPNNVGRCGHICNASYAVQAEKRGQHIGETLVLHCIAKAREMGFGILQFNAVVSTNVGALKLYEKLGFKRLGVIPKGFRLKDGNYESIIPHYFEL